MTMAVVSFAKAGVPSSGIAVVISDDEGRLGREASALDAATGHALTRGIKAAAFKGKAGSTLDIVAPAGVELDRVVILGCGKCTDTSDDSWLKLGGSLAGKLGDLKAVSATLLLERPDGEGVSADHAAAVAQGALLRSYTFDKYKTRKADDEAPKSFKLTIAVEGHTAAKKAHSVREAVTDGVIIARDLVNEPPNVLGPIEFAAEAKKLSALGVEVEIMTEKDLKKLGMNAYLGVGVGSVRPPRFVVMRWNGGKEKDKPVAFIGKGVVFDTGGISIKPASGMEDMKGDMAGAACVLGLMHTLAARKAKANVVCALGLVENMPDGAAQRPGDIVTSMSGQTIEIINTDAEGRLVLCDVLWYIQDKYKPAFMIDLATLTGAILVALGQEHAGLFSNDDTLAEHLTAAGKSTGERVWRMPLGPDYDKQIDSKFADMKNTGGRHAGSITAAQFLQRFVNGTPWAHLDIAGTGMSSLANEINKSWGSGWGVRLLDQLVRDHYEG
jgi:leucyl aminopeptidase